ncbi:hypothetical protein FE257_004247 [Aspergillus nanangensis]|uniref:Zn(2)-C6 fungal-type domain-containing protein n=1 Tax=Aspergillus nanangensis TaxID=2582783 RepID=A0AAD4CRH0_ASPNN|nr:hypothetical protein FE257_004247 [Aspergillus nanangensis]
MALRESFGDRKIPDISRKITACVACRKLKIKCHMDGNKVPCSRCKSRGLACTVNKSLQMLLEGDASWKESIERRMEQLEKALRDSVCEKSTRSSSYADGSTRTSRSTNTPIPRPPLETPSMVTLNLSCSLGAFPASSIMNMTFNTDQAASSGQQRPDLISCQVITHDIAEEFFAFYKDKLDPCIHHILAEGDTLASTRARSSLLTAAICTVAAFCTGSKHYQNCFNAFTKEVSGKMFSPRCITKIPHVKWACYDRTRLYFLLYLCDHHCSLSHGRPPLTRDFHSLKEPRDFLQSKFSTRSDLKLISQIELWSISSRVYDIFGADIENPVATHRSGELERLSTAYDRWYHEWLGVLGFEEGIGDLFPRRMFDLYIHSAKLYLFSHVFRGSAQETQLSPDASKQGTSNFAQRALENALSIIRCIMDDGSETRPSLERLPLYFGTMAAFASVCLVKASSQQRTVSDISADQIIAYLRQFARVLQATLTLNHPTHPLLSIAKSLELATGGQPGADQGDINLEDNLTTDFDFESFTNDGMNMGLFRDSSDWASFFEL